MTTTLDGALKRALVVNGEPYTLTITPDGLKLVPKGRRNGYALAWRDLVSGEAALAVALNASLHGAPAPRKPTAANEPVPAPTRKAASKTTPAPRHPVATKRTASQPAATRKRAPKSR